MHAPTPLVHLHPKCFCPLDLGYPISNEPFQMITNHLKENIQDDYYVLSGPSSRSAFFFSIISLILSGFLLTSFHIASLSAFSWLYTLVCTVVQTYHKIYCICNYSHFKYSFCNQRFYYLYNLKKLYNLYKLVLGKLPPRKITPQPYF